MLIKKIGAPIAILTAAALSLTSCAANESAAPAPSGSGAASALSGTIAGQGSSAMGAAQKTWIAEFQTANPQVTVNYNPAGSGAGREAFVAGAVLYAGSDRAFKDDEMGAGKFGKCTPESSALNLPTFVSPIAVMFNLEGVKELKLKPEVIAGIFSGQITKWNDPAITADNPGVTLPDAAITAVHRADDSGTTENFTDYLSKAAPEVWTEEADGEWPSAFPGEAAQGTSGVVGAVTNGQNTIGYADLGQVGDLGKVSVGVGSEFVAPTAEGAAKMVEASPKVPNRAEHDWALNLDRKAAGAYPIALVAYTMVCEDYADDADTELAKAYVGYTVSAEGQKVAQDKAGAAALSAKMQANVKAAIDSIK